MERRADLTGADKAVSEVLDEINVRMHGILSSGSYHREFADWLAERGYVIAPAPRSGHTPDASAADSAVVPVVHLRAWANLLRRLVTQGAIRPLSGRDVALDTAQRIEHWADQAGSGHTPDVTARLRAAADAGRATLAAVDLAAAAAWEPALSALVDLADVLTPPHDATAEAVARALLGSGTPDQTAADEGGR